eukprot:2541188-Amphidinium_carterae.1
MTPDLEIQYQDLTQHRVIALQRGFPVPERISQSFYTFDPIDVVTMERLRVEARSLAEVLGISVPGSVGLSARWVFADPAHDKFGEEVPQEVIDDDN